jgi:sporulation protein YlmC with PRC-barrel domain
MSAQDPQARDAHLELLDRQILDHDGLMLGKVDDVELEEREDGRIYVTALLTGPGALGPRFTGALGSIITRTWSRLSGRTEPGRVDWSEVASVGTAIELGISRTTAAVDGFETWMRENVIAAIPGAKVNPK